MLYAFYPVIESLLLFLLTLSSPSSVPSNGRNPVMSENFSNLTAAAQQAEVFDKLLAANGTHGNYPSAWQFIKFLREDFKLTFDYFQNSLPSSHSKAIHSIGSVAMAKFEPSPHSNHTFTGLFQGDPYLIVRLSLAASPSRTSTVPGIAVKFFRNGMPTANFVAMYDINGQSSGNFFENEFTNHISSATGVKKAIAYAFCHATAVINMVGLSDIASTDVEGNKVDEKDINFPFKLILVPNDELKKQFADLDPLDNLENRLNEIPSGTKLYEVYGQETPQSKDKRVFIGSIVTTSALLSSKYGDEVLFFRHQRMEDDLILRKEWKIEDPGCPVHLGHRIENDAMQIE